jgi:hypothetical protein
LTACCFFRSGASFVFAAKIEKSELLWRHRYQAADNVDFSDVHLHHDFLITVGAPQNDLVESDWSLSHP